jgi:ATP-dependent helicase STH1/SNF2
MPAAVPSGKLKLTFNKDQYANGGSSGLQSDEDD